MLGEGGSALSKTFERLSSGQRINRASDDAAGLAIADSLRTGARVLTQGVRNLNDAVSYYSVAQGASSELKNIIFRAKELAEQSANGTYSDRQRGALDLELQTIGAEYNRILSGTAFNGLNVFSRSENTLTSQAGESTLRTTLNSERATQIDTISRVSVGYDGSEANADSKADGQAPISADGRYAVFCSSATNLVAGVTGTQVYRQDLQSGKIEVVSTSSTGAAGNGASSQVSISSDGRYAVFRSIATNLISGVGDGTRPQIFRKDLQTGQIQVVSTSSSGVTAGGSSSQASISADGRYVAFQSSSSNLVSGISGIQIYRKDMQTGQTQVASCDSAGTTGVSQGFWCTALLSAEGRYVVFSSTSSSLISGVSGFQIYRKDMQTGQIQLVSSDSNGLAASGGASAGTFIVPDGRYAIFTSTATNLVSGVGDGVNDQVYRKDLQTGEIKVVSADSSGTAGNGKCSVASLSADGRYAAFSSMATNLVSGVGDGSHYYLYLKDLETQEIKCVNLSQSERTPTDCPTPSTGAFGAISSDGRHMVSYSNFKDQLDGAETGDRYHTYSTSNPFADQSSLTNFQWVNIKTQSEALNALTWFDSYLNELNTFQGDLGSSMSRLDVAKSVLAAMNENYLSAESRIRDADIAQESASLVRGQILQQVASSILSQANQQPALAIRLLQNH
jgi:flagellin-like hook-associated protein FlgL